MAVDVKKLSEDTHCEMMLCKKVLERFAGDYEFTKAYLKYKNQAVLIACDREERDLRCAKEELGRKPWQDFGFKDYYLK